MLYVAERFGRLSTSIKLLSIIGLAVLPLGTVALFASLSSIQTAKASVNATPILLAFLPLLMWISAALIVFLVIDRLLIRPLRTLQSAVASHVAGTPFQLARVRTPAREIQDLGDTFAEFADQIRRHEAKLAAALADQTRATREVHHRVKNNLQVIASLISLHARGAHASDAASAYAAIQRRVDALSIVHRNHYSGLDQGGGIDLKALLGELASNLRGGIADKPLVAAVSISAPRLWVSQDSAVAVAFLLTELIELSATLDEAAAIAIVVGNSAISGKARLSLTSTALRATPPMRARLSARYERVIEGLARQLRAPLSHNGTIGCFAIDFAIIATPN